MCSLKAAQRRHWIACCVKFNLGFQALGDPTRGCTGAAVNGCADFKPSTRSEVKATRETRQGFHLMSFAFAKLRRSSSRRMIVTELSMLSR